MLFEGHQLLLFKEFIIYFLPHVSRLRGSTPEVLYEGGIVQALLNTLLYVFVQILLHEFVENIGGVALHELHVGRHFFIQVALILLRFYLLVLEVFGVHRFYLILLLLLKLVVAVDETR